MKLTKIAAVAFGCAALMASCSGDIKTVSKNVKLSKGMDTVSYSLGFNFGNNCKLQMEQIPFGDPETILNKEAIIKGFAAALYNDSTISEDTLKVATKRISDAFMKKEQEKACAAFEPTAKKYEAEGFKSLEKFPEYYGPSVLLKVTEAGKGDSIKYTDIVYVDYVGKLTNDTIFDSTTGKEPAILQLQSLVPGFTQAMTKLTEGSKATFVIPSELGYQNREVGPIPANSTIVFDVDIKKVFHSQEEAMKFIQKLHPEMAKGQR